MQTLYAGDTFLHVVLPEEEVGENARTRYSEGVNPMKRIGIILGILLILAFLGAVLAPFLIDLNRYKDTILSQIEPYVPREVDFEHIELTVLSGLGASTAHVLPDAIFPDVIEWDELRTRERHEGVYYGIKNFSRKLAGAVSIFVVLQVLGWFGYQKPPEGATQFAQSPSALWAIRILTGPIGVAMLIASILVAWFYPLDKEKHTRMRRLLAKRRQQEQRRQQAQRRQRGAAR